MLDDRVAAREVGGGGARPSASAARAAADAARRSGRRRRPRSSGRSSTRLDRLQQERLLVRVDRRLVGDGPSNGASVIPIITSPSARGTANTKREDASGQRRVDRRARVADRGGRDEHVRALARAQAHGAAGQLAGPHAGRVDHVAGAELERAPAVRRARRRTRRAVGAQRARPHVGEDARAMGGGGAGDGEHEPRVVLDLAVPVQQRAAQAAVAEAGREPARLLGADAAGGRQAAARVPAAARSASPRRRPTSSFDAGAAVDLRAERDQQRQRADQVRRADVHQDRPLARGLPRDADVAVREVAQAAVRELGGPAARALREIAALDERDAQPARGGVERDPRRRRFRRRRPARRPSPPPRAPPARAAAARRRARRSRPAAAPRSARRSDTMSPTVTPPSAPPRHHRPTAPPRLPCRARATVAQLVEHFTRKSRNQASRYVPLPSVAACGTRWISLFPTTREILGKSSAARYCTLLARR